MESFENRFARLTPEQQKTIEDFTDFLLLKNTLRGAPVVLQPPAVTLNTPPVMAPDPAPCTARIPAELPAPVTSFESSSQDLPAETDPLPIHEITVGDEDWISRDYMDYGKFDQNPSPATEAVRKVKQKIITRQEQEKGNHLLDWVD